MLTTMRDGPAIAMCCAAFAGCNSLLGVHDFPADGSVGADTSADDDATPADAPVDCDPLGDFMTPHVITELDSAGHDTFVTDVSAAGTTIYLSSDRAGKMQLFIAERVTPTGTFGAPVPLPTAPTAFSTPWITLSPDAGTGVIATATADGAPTDLFPVTENLSDYDVGAGLAFNSGGIEDTPRLSRDGKTLFLSSDRDQAGMPHLYSSRGSFTTATKLDGIDLATANESAPALTANDLVLYFTRGTTMKGNGDIYTVTRASKADNFDNPTKLPGDLNTAADETVGAVSPDGCSLYFSRSDGTHVHPFVAQKPPR